MSTKRIHVLLLGAAAMGSGTAHAVANYKVEQIQKLVKRNKATGKNEVVGTRVHILVENESYDHFRINLAPVRQLDARTKAEDTFHRKTLAGMVGDFLYTTLAERHNVANNVAHELYVDIPYKKLGLKGGDRVNMLASFTNDNFQRSSTTGPHTFGAWDGPVNQGDKDYVITLVSKHSKVPVATETVKQAATP